MTACFHSNPVPSCLRDYMKQVFRLEYTQDPDYTQLKKLFQRELKHIGCKDDSKDLDWLTSTKKVLCYNNHIQVLYCTCS